VESVALANQSFCVLKFSLINKQFRNFYGTMEGNSKIKSIRISRNNARQNLNGKMTLKFVFMPRVSRFSLVFLNKKIFTTAVLSPF